MIKVTLKGSVSKLIETADKTDAQILQGMRIGLERALQFAVGQAGTTFMSGPSSTMLGVRTGRLRGALASEVEATANTVIGRIGDNVPYAAKWEFGFDGVENVRAHTRVTGWTGAGGNRKTFKEIKRVDNNRNVIGSFRQDIRPAGVRAGLSNFTSLGQVKAHQRKLHLTPRPFLLPALEATDIGGEINKAVREQK